MSWMRYHICEEFLISLICFLLGAKALRLYRASTSSGSPEISPDIRNRIFLFSMGFFLLFLNSGIHSIIHELNLSSNLLFHTLFGYTLGLLVLIFSISFRDPTGKKYLPFILYVPLGIMLLPWLYPALPPFTEFRPMVWVLVTYLSGTLFLLSIALFQNTRLRSFLGMAAGFLLIAVAGIFLFFPSAIGSVPWIHGHLIRPAGFLILILSVRRETLLNLRGSILYRALVSFSLLAAIPLLFFGSAIFYEEMNPLGVMERRFLIFVLLLCTLVAALFFGVGTVLRLIKPIIELKDGVASYSREGFRGELRINTGDEIEELTGAFNKMVGELKQGVQEQERLSRLAAMGELSARLAHEIRNPLNAIQGAASYISKNYRGRLISEFLHIIREEVSRINVLTTALLNFAKPLESKPSMTDINEVAKETISLISPEFDDRGVTLETDLAKGIPSSLFDRNQIKQVIINFMLNALDASEEGRKVRVSTRNPDGSLVLSVTDEGKGIREEEIEHIFRPFYTTKTKGTGLGLAIAERIAEEHGGRIEVVSAEGKGSLFSLHLPIRQ